MDKIDGQILRELRMLVSNADNLALYNLFGAIRGNDRGKQFRFKYVTIAIRGYVGLTNVTCSGTLPTKVNKQQILKQIERVYKASVADETHDTRHYVSHLKYAIRSIGKKNLIKYVEAL